MQIETNLVLLLPPLIEEHRATQLHLAAPLWAGVGASRREVTLKETTMRRTLQMIYRKDSYLSPAARFVNLLRAKGKALFEAEL